MTKSKCTICGWIYDSEKGYPQGNIKPNTSFEMLPKKFRCPECGAMKKWFVEIEE
jgi:rubredoxin